MKIESTIKRDGGSDIPIGTITYKFRPDAEYGGAHVADVEQQEHLAAFLAIADGFRIAVQGDKPHPVPEPVTPIVSPQAAAGPLLTKETLDLPADVAPEAVEPPAQPDAIDVETADHEDLVALFEAHEGRKPHPNVKTETLREKLKALAKTDT